MEFLASLAIKVLIGTSVCGAVTVGTIYKCDKTLLGFEDNTKGGIDNNGETSGPGSSDGTVVVKLEDTPSGSETGQNINTSERNLNTGTMDDQTQSEPTDSQEEKKPVLDEKEKLDGNVEEPSVDLSAQKVVLLTDVSVLSQDSNGTVSVIANEATAQSTTKSTDNNTPIVGTKPVGDNTLTGGIIDPATPPTSAGNNLSAPNEQPDTSSK